MGFGIDRQIVRVEYGHRGRIERTSKKYRQYWEVVVENRHGKKHQVENGHSRKSRKTPSRKWT